MDIVPNPLRIAVWGVGRHAQRTVLPAIRASHHVQLVGVWSRNRDVVVSACAQYQCRSWSSVEEMLSDQGVDAIYLSTPVGVHHEQGLAVLGNGKHLICEKSLTVDKASAVALEQAAAKGGRMLFETFMYLYHPRFCGLQEMLNSGRIGNLVSLSCTFTLPALEFPGYRIDPSLGGGALLDAGCYPVSLALALDPAPPVVKYARVDTPPDMRVDTFGTAVLRLGGGADAMLTWGYGCGYRNEVTLVAENGSVHIGYVFSKGGEQCCVTTLYNRFGKTEVLEYPVVDSFREMFAAIHASAHSATQQKMDALRAVLQANVLEAVKSAASKAHK